MDSGHSHACLKAAAPCSGENREQLGQISPAARPLRVGMLTNPLSGGNRRGIGPIRSVLAEHPEVTHRDVQTPSDVASALSDLARVEAEVVVLNAGDGTIQAALTALFDRQPFDTLPLLAVLRSGTASMTARDVGLRGSVASSLQRLLTWARSQDRQVGAVQRPVLRVQASPDQDPLYGMFFGAGAIHKGIQYFHRKIRGFGLRGELSSGLTLARCLWAAFCGDADITTPVHADVILDQKRREEKDFVMLLVTSLERLIVGLRPYFGTGDGPLHYTAVGAHHRRLLLALPSLLRGRPCRYGTPENGYFSHNVREARLGLDAGFALDGELYEADPCRGPVVLRNGGTATFLRL